MTTEVQTGSVSAQGSFVDRISPFQQRTTRAWEELSGPDGSRVNSRKVLAVLWAELAYHRACRTLRDRRIPPGGTEALLKRAVLFYSPDGLSAAYDFFDQAHAIRTDMLAGTIAAGSIDTVADRQLTASIRAMNHLSRLMATQQV